MLTRNLYPEDFDRINHYAHRIRGLGRTTFAGYKDLSSTPSLSSHVLPIILARNPKPGPLLDGLNYAFIRDDQSHGYAVLPRLILGPSMESLDVMVGDKCGTALTAWKNLRTIFAERSVDLKRVAIYIRRPPSSLSPTGSVEVSAPLILWQEEFALSLLAFHKLTSIDIGELYWNPTTLKFLSDLKTLRVLRVSLSIDPRNDEKAVVDESVFDHNHFTNLDRLILLTPSLEAALCKNITTSIKSNPSIHSLTLYETEPSTVELQTFLENAFEWHESETSTHQNSPPFSNLESLHIERNTNFGPGPRSVPPAPVDSHPYIIGPYTLTPLFNLKHLRRLKVNTARTSTMDNNSLRELGKALPKLDSLILMEYGTEAPPKITLLGFLHLLSACPSLKELALRLDARQMPSYVESKEFKPHAADIKLHFLGSPIAHASQLAHFLILHTPALTNLEYFEEEEWVADWYDHSWMKVKMQVAPLLKGAVGNGSLSEGPRIEEVDP